MNLPPIRRLSLSLAALAVCFASLYAADPAGRTPTRPADIPVESFFRSPAVRIVRLNPAGTHVALLTYDPKADINSLVILDLAAGQVKGLRGTTELNLGNFAWTDDEHLVLSAIRDNHYAGGLYAVSRDNPTNVSVLNRYDVVEVLGVPHQRPDRLLLWIRRSAADNGRDLGVQEIDLRSNRLHPTAAIAAVKVLSSLPIPRGYTGARHWLRDREGEIRYAVAHLEGRLFLLRRDPKDQWVRVDIDLETDRPLAVDADPAVLLVAHRNPGGGCDLVRLNTRDGSHGPSLYSDEKYDFGDAFVSFSSEEKDVLGLTYARQAPEQVWLRDEEAGLQRSIDAVLPERVNQVVNRSRDGQHLVVRSSSDRHPGTLFLFDRKTQKLQTLSQLAPWLAEPLMAPVRITTYTARDGLRLDAYVTLPLDHDPAKPGPMVVLPHGGPWVRDAWGYDPESQFFASRGYIVFRPNYRGSSGYNAAISSAPRVEFRKMHEDVTDGVRALITAKIADPAHIAIVGASFGGYLSMCGAAFEPGLYRCAVSIAGVFDWERVMKEDRNNEVNLFRSEWLRRDLGDPKAQREKFEAMSPFYSVAQIKAPVFIIHGADDENADTSQSRRLVKALKAAGVKHETFFIPRESHGLAELQHRVELYTRIEAFLKRNL